ncbi:MAG: hypothetical protein ACFFG0_05220 [Candidatus Thorarchaeota archaeon]
MEDVKILNKETISKKPTCEEIMNDINNITPEKFANFFKHYNSNEIVKRNRRYYLETIPFGLENNKKIRELLFKKLKIKTSILARKNKKTPHKRYYYLYFAKSTFETLKNVLKEFMSVDNITMKLGSSETRREPSNNNILEEDIVPSAQQCVDSKIIRSAVL